MHWFLPALLVAAPAVASTQTVLVAPISAQEDLKADAEALKSLLAAQLVQNSDYRLVTPEQMKTIDEEMVRQLEAGCDDATCLNEVGGMLGATHLLSGELTKISDRMTLSVKLVEVKTVASVGTGLAVARDIGGLIDALPKVVEQLLGRAKAPSTQLKHKARKPLFIGSAAGLIVGGAVAVMGMTQVNYYQGEFDALPDSALRVRGELKKSANQWQIVMASGIGVAVLSTVGVASALILD